MNIKQPVNVKPSGNGKPSNGGKAAKREINWQAIYDSIAVSKKVLENMGAVSEEERERIWKERAHQFAQVPQDEDAGNMVHLAVVRMGRELCALDVSCIESIRPMEKITRVPRTPNWVMGVSNLRGQIYSVTDLKKFLHLGNGHESSGDKGEILLVKTKGISLALRVDEVRSVETIQESRVNPVSETIHGVRPEFVRGVIEDYEVNNEKVPALALNMDALLSHESLIVREELS